MSRNMKGDDALTGKRCRLAFFEKEVGSHWVVLNVKSMTLEKAPIRNHGNRIWMTDDLAPMPSLDFTGIHHMIKVTVSENEPIDFLRSEMVISTLRRIEKNVAGWRFEEISVGRQSPPCENLKLDRCHNGQKKMGVEV